MLVLKWYTVTCLGINACRFLATLLHGLPSHRTDCTGVGETVQPTELALLVVWSVRKRFAESRTLTSTECSVPGFGFLFVEPLLSSRTQKSNCQVSYQETGGCPSGSSGMAPGPTASALPGYLVNM